MTWNNSRGCFKIPHTAKTILWYISKRICWTLITYIRRLTARTTFIIARTASNWNTRSYFIVSWITITIVCYIPIACYRTSYTYSLTWASKTFKWTDWTNWHIFVIIAVCACTLRYWTSKRICWTTCTISTNWNTINTFIITWLTCRVYSIIIILTNTITRASRSIRI